MEPTGIVNKALSKKLGGGLENPATAASDFWSALVNWGLVLGSITFVLMFLWGGFQWITSGGSKEAVMKSKNRITNALIGLVILFSFYAIITLLSDFLGINLVEFKLPGWS